MPGKTCTENDDSQTTLLGEFERPGMGGKALSDNGGSPSFPIICFVRSEVMGEGPLLTCLGVTDSSPAVCLCSGFVGDCILSVIGVFVWYPFRPKFILM
ncbi:hypothetical protein NPIL_346791 [Nephila pilipes]|uniref:Uncharacterized protein n=1 Tax=Nephila pilipes TaxID=299642 RepID=A0A8X6PPY3_NEPPI|nr:hypothetical protein NPIL_346791 [Nephila pilipes]